jgi:type I restriction enzyme, S subunit
MVSEGFTNPTSLPKLPDGWHVLAIEELCKNVTSGGTPLRSNSRFYHGGIYSWFKTQELRDTVLYESNEKITEYALENSSAKLFPKNTVLMAMYGDGKTITSLGILTKAAATNQACCAMIPDPALCEARFLFYALKYHRNEFLQIASGGAQRNLSGRLIRRFALNAPSLPEQRAIVHILGTLDDKIELNQQMNETLEATARALFKSWFIDFDPVRAKAEGRALNLPQHVADLFPDSTEETELGVAPAGWSVEPLNKLAGYINRGISPSYLETGGICVLNQKCIRDRRVDFTKARRHDQSKKPVTGRTLQYLDIVVNSTGVGTLGRVAQVFSLPEETITDSHVTIVRATAGIEPLFLGTMLTGRESEIEELGEGSTGQTELSRTRLGNLKCLVPGGNLQRAFASFAAPLYSEMAANNIQSDTLAVMRDALLPKLLSGEIRVRDVEHFTEARDG